MNRLSLFVAGIALGHLLACMPAQEPTDIPAPPRLRAWTCTIDKWMPTGVLELQRLNQRKQDAYVAYDNRKIEQHVVVPGDAGRLVCNLRIKLGKGLHRQSMADYWPCVKRGLESIGIGARMGALTYDEVRGETKDDFATTIELREVR